jgi:adenylate cyclase class IV
VVKDFGESPTLHHELTFGYQITVWKEKHLYLVEFVPSLDMMDDLGEVIHNHRMVN